METNNFNIVQMHTIIAPDFNPYIKKPLFYK